MTPPYYQIFFLFEFKLCNNHVSRIVFANLDLKSDIYNKYQSRNMPKWLCCAWWFPVQSARYIFSLAQKINTNLLNEANRNDGCCWASGRHHIVWSYSTTSFREQLMLLVDADNFWYQWKSDIDATGHISLEGVLGKNVTSIRISL